MWTHECTLDWGTSTCYGGSQTGHLLANSPNLRSDCQSSPRMKLSLISLFIVRLLLSQRSCIPVNLIKPNKIIIFFLKWQNRNACSSFYVVSNSFFFFFRLRNQDPCWQMNSICLLSSLITHNFLTIVNPEWQQSMQTPSQSILMSAVQQETIITILF